MAYQGKFEHVLDNKNRLFVPSIFRVALGDRFVAVKGPERCIAVYDEKTWEEYILPQINEYSGTPQGRKKQRALYSSAVSLEPDKQGRITLSKELVEYAGLGSEVIVLGAARRVEIWSKEKWVSDNTDDDDIPEITW